MCYMGLNIVGLQRRNFPQEQIDTISKIYHLLFVGNHSISTAIGKINDQVPDGELKTEILQFIQASKIGVIKRYAKNGSDDDQAF
jgi:UDP-N-acetylglucosamine acyltransferase